MYTKGPFENVHQVAQDKLFGKGNGLFYHEGAVFETDVDNGGKVDAVCVEPNPETHQPIKDSLIRLDGGMVVVTAVPTEKEVG